MSASESWQLLKRDTVLTDDEFDYGGATYTIAEITHLDNSSNRLDLRFSSGTAAAAKTALAGLTLRIGTHSFAINDASPQTSGSQRLRWSPTALSTSNGDKVGLSLTGPALCHDQAEEAEGADGGGGRPAGRAELDRPGRFEHHRVRVQAEGGGRRELRQLDRHRRQRRDDHFLQP